MGRRPGSKNKPKTAPTAAEPAIGHNSNLTAEQQKKLHGFVSEIEAFEAEKAQIADDIKEIYGAAKEAGFDTATVREVIRRRKQGSDERRAREVLIDAYMHALGMLADTPLGKAAMERDIPEFLDRRGDAAASEQPAA